MLTVRVAVRVQPDGRDRFIAQLRREQVEVPARFPGCERFSVFSDPADPDSLLVYEEWFDSEAFDGYRTSDYFAESANVLFPLLDGSPDSAYYQSERVGP